MCTHIDNSGLSLEEKKKLLKPVEEILKAKFDNKNMFQEPLFHLLGDNEDGGQHAFVYRHFIKSLLLLMTIPKNAAKLKKIFGSDAFTCFDTLLLFFELLERESVDEWIDYIHCTTYTGHLNQKDVYKLRNKYLNDNS